MPGGSGKFILLFFYFLYHKSFILVAVLNCVSAFYCYLNGYNFSKIIHSFKN